MENRALHAVEEHTRSLSNGGSVILVHWIGPTDYPLGSDAAAALFVERIIRRASSSARRPISLISPGRVVARLSCLRAGGRANDGRRISVRAIRPVSANAEQTE